MDMVIDFILLGVLIIGLTAFLGPIGRAIVRPFMGQKADLYVEQTALIKKGWKKVGGRES